ncbi:MAG: GNAT family N-acetyltransferase [Prevotellaceae bacterium]|jgi:diamine N-acetyltransferase|nr:GNAT family N-acetyltransferase [Prevotellaceae bacterium]
MPSVLLRAVEPLDLELLYEWENNPDLWGVGDTLAPLSRSALQRYLQEAQQDLYAARQLRLMVDIREDDGLRATVGAVDLFDFDPRHLRAGVGVLIYDPAMRRKGYATQALQQLVRYAFGTLRLHQLHCSVAEGNAASIALMRKLGFETSGVKKDWRAAGQAYENELFMQLIYEATTLYP